MKKFYFVNKELKWPEDDINGTIKNQIKTLFKHTKEDCQIVNDHNCPGDEQVGWSFYRRFNDVEYLICHPDSRSTIFQVLEINVNQNDLMDFLSCTVALIPWVAKYYIYDHDNKKIKLITEEMF